MKQGYLSSYFKGAASKTLSAVEADMHASRQHEFNGVKLLKQLLGEHDGKQEIPTKYIYLDDILDEPVIHKDKMTWYDSRRNKPHRAAEYRLYYYSNPVTQRLRTGDTLVLALLKDDSLLCLCLGANSSIASQVLWLFDLKADTNSFEPNINLTDDPTRRGMVARMVLDQIGIDPEPEVLAPCDMMMSKFASGFPTTAVFSKFARGTVRFTLHDMNADQLLIEWLNREEELFRWLEHELIRSRLQEGFGDDVDSFIAFSLSVQNRRKSRVGHALENHLHEMFERCGVRFSHTPVTENGNRPDFLFPDKDSYNDPTFPVAKLDMLGVKSTCKDRWRQVLAEAERIEEKHLLTLQAPISVNQTDEMKAKRLQLVVPKPLHSAYKEMQQAWLIDLDTFISNMLAKQKT